MDSLKAARIAVRSIRANRLRTALTVVGIVIGIASVVTFATFGASVRADVIDEVEGSSANNVYVLATPEDDEGGFDQAIRPVFTARDVDRLEEIDGVQRVFPRGNVPAGTLRYRNDTVAQDQVTATVPGSVESGDLVRGRAFRAGANEVVLNRAAVEAFDRNVTLNATITMTRPSGNSTNLTVVGVVNRTAGQLPFGSFGGQARFFVPVDPFYETVVESPSLGVNQRSYPQLTVVADSTRTAATKRRVRRYLQEESDAARLVPEGLELTAQTSGDFVDRIQDVIDRITQFVTGIAVIALVVAAIGIANIMLVSVAERTKEIGIMKSVGATNRDILQLFLFESATLGVVGAVLGLPLGIVVAYGATRYAEVGFTVAYDWLVIAVVAGLLIGVLAGIYPAWRAARVNPIDALRRE